MGHWHIILYLLVSILIINSISDLHFHIMVHIIKIRQTPIGPLPFSSDHAFNQAPKDLFHVTKNVLFLWRINVHLTWSLQHSIPAWSWCLPLDLQHQKTSLSFQTKRLLSALIYISVKSPSPHSIKKGPWKVFSKLLHCSILYNVRVWPCQTCHGMSYLSSLHLLKCLSFGLFCTGHKNYDMEQLLYCLSKHAYWREMPCNHGNESS